MNPEHSDGNLRDWASARLLLASAVFIQIKNKPKIYSSHCTVTVVTTITTTSTLTLLSLVVLITVIITITTVITSIVVSSSVASILA